MLHTFPHSWIKIILGKKRNPNNAEEKNPTSASRAFYFFLKTGPRERDHFLFWAKNGTLRIIHPLNWFPA